MPRELEPVCGCLNGLLERLERAFARERRLTADAAHELRTPIAELRTLAEVGLAEAKTGCPEMTGYFEDALGVTRRLESLVTALLYLARCEAGAQKAEMRPVDIAELTRELWRVLSPITHTSYEVQLDVPEQAFVTADPELLKTILSNLLSNALAYTPSGGKIQVSIHRTGNLGDTIPMVSPKFSWMVSIANTSHELLAADIEHVFEPFWQKHADRGDTGHCGLGLALVAACARLMAIPIRTEIAANTLFVIAFECPAAA